MRSFFIIVTDEDSMMGDQEDRQIHDGGHTAMPMVYRTPTDGKNDLEPEQWLRKEELFPANIEEPLHEHLTATYWG